MITDNETISELYEVEKLNLSRLRKKKNEIKTGVAWIYW